MESKDCPECSQLDERFWALHAECVGARDELTMTRRNHPSYLRNKKSLKDLKAYTETFFTSQVSIVRNIEAQTDPEPSPELDPSKKIL
jgi:hypothetical protein